MRIVFLGTGEFGVPALHALRGAGHEIVVAISQPDRPAGRGREIRPTPVHAAADELSVPHIQAADVNALDLRPLIAQAEIGVVAAFGQKLDRSTLAALPCGFVNIHGSLLPRLRGAAPIQRAIIDGEEVTGVTVFQLNERWDAGHILGARATPISDRETADELHDRLAALGAVLIVEVLAAIQEGTACPREQDVRLATRAPKLTKAEGTVDWTLPAQRVVRRIHGLWSWPAAACQFVSRRGSAERVLLARAEVADRSGSPSAACPAGSILADLTVQCGLGRVRLLELRPASGKLMSFDAFARGRHVAPPDKFEPVRFA